jgi:hypothetical protein
MAALAASERHAPKRFAAEARVGAPAAALKK